MYWLIVPKPTSVLCRPYLTITAHLTIPYLTITAHLTTPSPHLTLPYHQTISGMTSPVQSVTFNNAENWVAAGSKSGVIKVFDCEENRGEHYLDLLCCPNRSITQLSEPLVVTLLQYAALIFIAMEIFWPPVPWIQISR